jgi:hypothetical protein
MPAPRQARVLHAADHGPLLPIVEGKGTARAIVWPGVGAALRSMHRIELADGSEPLLEGSMIHVEPGTAYQFEASADGMLLLGGPCPADPALYQESG